MTQDKRSEARDIISRAGGPRTVARALGMRSDTNVRRWYGPHGKGIPDVRLADVLALLTDAERAPSNPHVPYVSPAQAHVAHTHASEAHVDHTPPHVTRAPVALTLACAAHDNAMRELEHARAKAHGRSPKDVPCYGALLAAVALIEVPVLSHGILMLSNWAPIMAYCTAIGSAAVMIIGAHMIGKQLRVFGDQMREGITSAISLATWAALTTLITGLFYRLRAESVNGASMMIEFGNAPDVPNAAAQLLIALSGSVMAGGTLIAVALSYGHHSPRANYAQAERAYRKALIHLEKVSTSMNLEKSS
jgi:hypothetical protein